MPKPIRRNWLLVILAIALFGRVALAAELQVWLDRQGRQFLIEGDANGNWELGQRLAEGRPYELHVPPRRVLRMPGFPAVLALSMKLPPGGSLLIARILLAAIGTAACGLVYLLGRELADEETGLIAAGFTAISPVMAGFSVVILSETLFAACLLASLLFMAKLVRTEVGSRHQDAETRGRGEGANLASPRVSASPPLRVVLLCVAAGVTAAMACYARPSWLLVAPGFAVLHVLMADEKKQALFRGLLVVAVLFLSLLPWAIRNHQVTGHWVFTTLWLGPSLYDGLNPDATGESDMTFYGRDRPVLEKMSEYEVDRYYRRRAWEFVVENPGQTLELAAVKFVRFWKPWPNAPQFGSLANRVAVSVFFVPMVILAVLGCWTRRKDVWFWLLTIGPVLYFTVLHMIFVSSLRYRLPAEYPLWIASAAGLQCWLASRNERATKP